MYPDSQPNIRFDKYFSLIVIIVFFGVFGLWAGLAPLESAALASGKIIVAGYQKTIQHLEGGIVKKIFVKDGSQVKKGQILLQLQKTQDAGNLLVTRNQLLDQQTTLIRLESELNGRNEPDFSSLKKSQSLQFDKYVALQQSTFKANTHAFNESVHIHQQKISQLQQQINGIYALMRSNQHQSDLIKKELKDMHALLAKRLVKQSRVLSLEREAARLEGQQGESQAQVAQLAQKISEIKIEISKLKNDHHSDLLDKIKHAQQKIHDLIQEEKIQVDILKRTAIRSPISGTVVGLQVHTVGAVIKPGDVLMNVVPKHESLIVEVKIRPVDIDVVYPGQQARVRISAFNQRTGPVLDGTVSQVSADALVDPSTQQAYYLAQIRIKKSDLNSLDDMHQLYPGMPVEAMIVTNKLTPWEYFTAPVSRSFSRAFRED